jgi:hypothetical protein
MYVFQPYNNIIITILKGSYCNKTYFIDEVIHYVMTDQRGQKDGSQSGKNAGGRGRNQTPECRNPTKKKARKN